MMKLKKFDCQHRIAASPNSAASAQNAATTSQGSESLLSRLNASVARCASATTQIGQAR